jgi:DNA-binding PadR family transcriptional regulator
MPKGRFLAEFEMYVMLAVVHLGERAYGVAIRRAIEERTDRPVSIGAVYATASRLEDKGFLAHDVTDPRPVPGGRSRKVYSLTPPGREALGHSTTMLARMLEGLDPEGLGAWAP